MANLKSSIKRARQEVKRRAHNRSKKSAVRTAFKKADTAITEGNKELTKTSVIEAQSIMAKLAKSSAMRKKTASRLISRLAKRANKIA